MQSQRRESRGKSNSNLPGFRVEMWSEDVRINIDVEAIDRAHWAFEQPTIGGLVSNFTYNEYPLKVVELSIVDSNNIRQLSDYDWIRVMLNIHGVYCTDS